MTRTFTRLALYLDTRTFRPHFNSQNTHSQFRNSQLAFYPCPFKYCSLAVCHKVSPLITRTAVTSIIELWNIRSQDCSFTKPFVGVWTLWTQDTSDIRQCRSVPKTVRHHAGTMHNTDKILISSYPNQFTTSHEIPPFPFLPSLSHPTSSTIPPIPFIPFRVVLQEQ